MFFIFIAARTFYRKIYPCEEGFNIIDYRNGKLKHAYTNNDIDTQILVTSDDDGTSDEETTCDGTDAIIVDPT